MYIKILVISIFLFIAQHILHIVYMLDLHRTVWNHKPGPCRLVKGAKHGSEHIYTNPAGLAFITSGLQMPIQSAAMKEYNRKQNVKGRILLFDFNKPQGDAIELKITGDNIKLNQFNPHGIDGLYDEKTGTTTLYVVNHPVQYDTVEKFQYVAEKNVLQHLATFKHPSMKLLNDVAVTGEDTFYMTKYNHYRTHMAAFLESMLQLPWGGIIYYNGKTYEEVINGLLLPNGITMSRDKKYVYVVSPATRDLKIYKRETTNFLTLLNVTHMYTLPDNVLVDSDTGNLITGNHPVMYQAVLNMEKGESSAPSQVTLLHMDKDGASVSRVTEVYSDDGSSQDSIHGSSVAAIYKNKMLVGTVRHKMLYCDIVIPL